MRTHAHVFVLVLPACVSAELILKSPVIGQCNSAKLKGCDEMADGVIAYVDGKKDEGRKLLIRAAGKNAPKEVHAFAASLRSASKMPGLESYADTLSDGDRQRTAIARHTHARADERPRVRLRGCRTQGLASSGRRWNLSRRPNSCHSYS